MNDEKIKALIAEMLTGVVAPIAVRLNVLEGVIAPIDARLKVLEDIIGPVDKPVMDDGAKS